ncbi:winged helix-turn-helix transcriptional regulator [Nocardia sp. NBC_01730]|uniref:winged helix-turn-helix transcriptional regulator n=1 Tax=Nocardia sp. NBC_01730 TaxID=2975998 RepID=UPI002E107353|nr:winged helix-turn-helix transcriptional regulator [Nocardia sp. NBC_01730]
MDHRCCPGSVTGRYPKATPAAPRSGCASRCRHRPTSRRPAALRGALTKRLPRQEAGALVRDGLIARAVEPTTPPRVSYELTALGQGLTESLQQFLDWIRRHTVEVVAAQRRHDRQRR